MAYATAYIAPALLPVRHLVIAEFKSVVPGCLLLPPTRTSGVRSTFTCSSLRRRFPSGAMPLFSSIMTHRVISVAEDISEPAGAMFSARRRHHPFDLADAGEARLHAKRFEEALADEA